LRFNLVYFLDLAIYLFVCACVFARCKLQRLVEARLRFVYCRARLQLLGMAAQKWRAQSIYSALVRRFTAR
jgi:hypothetical protein